MSRLDEFEIINLFQKSFGRKSKFIPDDVEILRLNNTDFVAKSDMLVQSTDVPPGMKLEEVARKSVVACISDFASKGVKPRYATISLSIPKTFSRSKIMKLAKGFSLASREFRVRILGGDVNEGQELVIDVSMYGVAKKIIPRRGAIINDIIITSGPFGYSYAGLKIILNHLRASPSFIKKSKLNVYHPTPRLKFGLSICNFITSSMDSSDGLSNTLNEMSKQSKKKFVITKLPTDFEVEKFVNRNRIRLTDLVFCGGEEYEIVATASRKHLPKIKEIAKVQKVPLFEIGFVTSGRGVFFKKMNQVMKVKNCGWVHFRS